MKCNKNKTQTYIWTPSEPTPTPTPEAKPSRPSIPAPTAPLPPLLLASNPFRERVLMSLLPCFFPVTKEFEIARAEILETLAPYGVRTRPEVIIAARIIAFSFSALGMLFDVARVEMSPSLKLRYQGCANALNRSCQQDEQKPAKRLACDQPPGQIRGEARSRHVRSGLRGSHPTDRGHDRQLPPPPGGPVPWIFAGGDFRRDARTGAVRGTGVRQAFGGDPGGASLRPG
jgi:hypothetical protein